MRPNDTNAIFNLASALHRVGSLATIGAILSAMPQTIRNGTRAACITWALPTAALGENKKAIEYYDKALELVPERLDIKKDLALALLADGQFAQGLEAFEVPQGRRLRKAEMEQGRTRHPAEAAAKAWSTGKAKASKANRSSSIHEEGSGDFIHFCRFIPMLRECGASSVMLTGPVPDLLELVADNIAVDGLVPLAGPFECDYVVGSMSVPWRCGATLEGVSGKPYFKAEPATFPLRGLLNIGLVWRGNAAYARDVDRSMPLGALCPLFEIPDVAFYSLQVGDGAKEITTLGFDGFIGDLAPFAKNWRATAKLIKRLDAVVTVDTAVAHLAGALGVPVFILVTQCLRLALGSRSRQARDWYDSATVFRQHRHGDWGTCVSLAKRY